MQDRKQPLGRRGLEESCSLKDTHSYVEQLSSWKIAPFPIGIRVEYPWWRAPERPQVLLQGIRGVQVPADAKPGSALTASSSHFARS